jgi:hydrogenase nickel incorporation protein HypB
MAPKASKLKVDSTAHEIMAANKLRRKMAQDGTLVVRLISSPGSGKTLLLEKTAQLLVKSHSIAVLVGDVETDRDAQRLAPIVPTVQMTTGDQCHLEFPLVERALSELNQPQLDILFIEDVGNLICAPSHDLGEHLRVLLLSTTEGDDKPGKFPKAFRTSDVLLITKTDLLPYVSFSMKQAEKDARRVHPALKIFALSAQDGEGLTGWCEFLERERKRLLTAGNLGATEHLFPVVSQIAGSKLTHPKSHSGIPKGTKTAKGK